VRKKKRRSYPVHNGIREAISRAVVIFGSEKNLAEAVGVSQQNMNRVVRKGRVSAEVAIEIHRATKGFVPGNQLRPDLWRRPEDVPVEVQQRAASR